jgi:hypothetical protein
MERTRYPSEQIAQEVYASSAYLVINKRLLIHYGPNIAIFLSNLIDKHRYFKEHGQAKEDGWFYLVHEQQMEQTGLSLARIQNYKKVLKEDGVLETCLQGTPAKEWYRIDYNRLSAIVPLTIITPSLEAESPRGVPQETREQGLTETRGLDLIETRGHIYKENKYKENKKRGGVPPSIDSVVEYCKERNSTVDPYAFFDWNASKNWMIGKNKMVDWQAAVRTWERRDKEEGNKNLQGKRKMEIFVDGRAWTLHPDGTYRDKNGKVLDR